MSRLRRPAAILRLFPLRERCALVVLTTLLHAVPSVQAQSPVPGTALPAGETSDLAGLGFLVDSRLPATCLGQPTEVNDRAPRPKTIPSSSRQQCPSPLPSSAGLVLHLAFDGDLLDSSGLDNHATAVGPPGPISTSSPGISGNALSIRGGSTTDPSYLRVDNSPSISPADAITISAWVNPRGKLGGNGGIVFKGALIGRQPDYQLTINDGGTGETTGPSGASATVNGQLNTSPHNCCGNDVMVIDYDFLQPVPDSMWTHLAVTYDGSVMRLYVNGTLVDEVAHIDTIDQTGSPLFVGIRYMAKGDIGGFQGLIDELQIFDAALSSPEICGLANAGIAGTCVCAEFEECARFDDLGVGTTYNVGDVFTTAGTTVGVTSFVQSGGQSTTTGGATVENSGLAGGSGNEMALRSVNLEFSIGSPIPGLSLLYADRGGSLNLEVNGDLRVFEDMASIDGQTIGGAVVSVSGVPGTNRGSLTLEGAIGSFRIGGEELVIDVVCPSATGLDLRPGLSFHAGLAYPFGHLDNSTDAGPTLNVDLVIPITLRIAWDVRLGYSLFNGSGAAADVDMWNVSTNLRFKLVTGAFEPFINGGVGLYYIDTTDVEAGYNLGFGLAQPLSTNITLEATANYHSTMTASPAYRFGKIQLGIIWPI